MNEQFWDDFLDAVAKAAEGIRAEAHRIEAMMSAIAESLKPIADALEQRERPEGL